MSPSYLIYMLTSPSGKSYVGQTLNYQRRLREHKSSKKHNKCKAIFYAIEKYGWDSFKKVVLHEGLTKEKANELEISVISEMNTVVPNGYNISLGGAGSSYEKSVETRKKISQAQIGRKQSEETKIRLSIAHTGKKLSADHVEKIRNANKGRKYSEEFSRKMSLIAYSRDKPSEATRAKMSENTKRYAENIENRYKKKTYSNSTTGYKGVCFYKKTGKFRARLTMNNKRFCLGSFDTAEQAYNAYCIALNEYLPQRPGM